MTTDKLFLKKFVEKLFYVVNKEGVTGDFHFNDVQNRLLDALSGQDIVLKSRQQGISTLFLAYATVKFLTIENIRCVVIAHEAKVTQRLFDKVKFFLESVNKRFPGDKPYELKYNSRSEIVNINNNSTFYIGTAGQRAFGHGDTINLLHISELSRYQNPETLLSGLLQAVPKGGQIFIETTANGYNYFYRLWEKNRLKQSPFHTHFLPWFETKEYSMPVPTLFEITEEETAIAKKYNLKKEQLSWRRWKIEQLNGDIDRFNESFPANPEEAFITSGNNVWSNTLLRQYMLGTVKPLGVGNIIGYNPLYFDENEKGYIKIFKEPQEFHQYVIGADVSEGKIVAEGDSEHETDYSCAQVIDRNTYEQVAVWHGRIDPDQFGRQLETLGRYYNNALIAVERNAVGLTPLIVLRDLSYPNLYYRELYGLIADKRTPELGWVTDRHTKELIINDATHLLREKRLTLYDEDTVAEMMSFVRDSNGHASASSGAHDDYVMAYLIACKMLTQPMATIKGNPIERHDSESKDGLFFMNGVAFNQQGMPIDPDNFMGEETFNEF
ncbi:MAG: hypothetical protein PHE73_08890 [Sulfurovaceae bacterium]|nr:hypothetical protein [Sulfurovaceae bacterium]